MGNVFTVTVSVLLVLSNFVLLPVAFGQPASAPSTERSDSFFAHDYFNADRADQAESASSDGRTAASQAEGELRPEEDSWQAPKRAKDGMVRGQEVAGSSKVRDHKNRTGAFAPREEPRPNPGYQAVPLGGGAAIVIPNGDGFSYGGSDSFARDPRPLDDPIDSR